MLTCWDEAAVKWTWWVGNPSFSNFSSDKPPDPEGGGSMSTSIWIARGEVGILAAAAAGSEASEVLEVGVPVGDGDVEFTLELVDSEKLKI